MSFTIREISMDDTDAWAANWDVWNATWRELCGPRAVQFDPELIRQANRSVPPERLAHYWNAEIDGRGVGRLRASARIIDDPIIGFHDIAVLPEFRRRGIGTALLAIAEDYLHSRGSKRFQTGISAQAEDLEPVVSARKGLSEAGYRRFQRMIVRTLDLPAAFDLRLDSGYRISIAEGIPQGHEIDDLILLKQRMNTDAPHGDVELVEENWDAERVLHSFQSADNVAFFRAYAHTHNGDLAGYGAVSHEPEEDPIQNGMLWQADTLVLREHRGHGLGQALKAHLLMHAQERLPQLTWARTVNAEENAPMIRINEAMGYEIAGFDELYVKDAS